MDSFTWSGREEKNARTVAKTAFSKQALLHCAGIVGAGLLYSLGINLFVVPAGLYTGELWALRSCCARCFCI